jgi:putative transcriptional regulator
MQNMINANIRKAKKEKGISHEELAIKLNIVKQTVSK